MKYRLEDLFDLQMGKTPARNNPEYWNSADNKWISIGDLSKCGKYITNTKEYLSDAAVEESGISLIPENTVVMSFKLSIGKTAITSEPMYSNEAIMSFRDKHVVPILPDYLYYMFLAKDWDEGTNKAVMGKTLNKATLAKVTIDVHSPTEQRKIVDTLDKVASVIDARQQQLSTLDNLIKARFVEMFGDQETDSLNWNSIKLSTLCDLQNGYAFKSDDYLDYSSVFNCRMSNIRPNGGFDAEYNPKYLPDEYWDIYKSYRLYDGDVIIAMTDMASDPKILGVPTIVKTNGHRFLLNQRVGKLIFLDQDRINSTYLMTFLGQAYIRKALTKLAGGSTQINVGKPAILSLDILEPPRQLQDAFAEFAEQINKAKAAIQKSLNETQLLFDSLMQKYFG